MKAKDITIMHLSDLHFDAGRDMTYVNALLVDVKQQLKRVKDLIIVVTGDLSTKSCVSETRQDILWFFTELKSAIPKSCKLLGLEIVPGNHDLIRPICKNDFHKGSFCNDLREFDDLSTEVYGIFDFCRKDRVGVDFVEYNNQDIALVRIDTSGVVPDSDLADQIKEDFKKWKKVNGDPPRFSSQEVLKKRKAWVSQQIKEQGVAIRKAFYEHDKDSHRQVLFTIAIAHHPLNWLNESGIDQIQEILFKKGLQHTDLWLCGHMHTSQLYYTNENGHQKVMLMSGIGRQESRETNMRYSLYTLSLERNVCCIQSRGAKDGVGFDEDFSMGRGASKNSRHLTIPLRSPQVGSVLRLNNSGMHEDQKDCYVDDDVLGVMREMSERLSWFLSNINGKIKGYQSFLLNYLLAGNSRMREELGEKFLSYLVDGEDFTLTAKWQRTIDDFLMKKSYLSSFADDICNELYQCISRPIRELDGHPASPVFKDILEWKGIIWRMHLRLYKGVLASDLNASDDVYDVYASNAFAETVKSIQWSNSYIEHANGRENKILIQSANQLENPIHTDWDDFLTAVPVFSNSEVRLRTSIATYESRPILSFGVSVKCNSQESLVAASRVLYSLEFFRIDRLIGRVLDDFLRAMKIADVRRCI